MSKTNGTEEQMSKEQRKGILNNEQMNKEC